MRENQRFFLGFWYHSLKGDERRNIGKLANCQKMESYEEEESFFAHRLLFLEILRGKRR